MKIFGLSFLLLSFSVLADFPNTTVACNEAGVVTFLENLIRDDKPIPMTVKVLAREGGGNDFELSNEDKDVLRSASAEVTAVEATVIGCDHDLMKAKIDKGGTLSLNPTDILAIAAILDEQDRKCIVDFLSSLEK